MKIGIIGCGNMGEALLSGILRLVSPAEIMFHEINDKQSEKLTKTYGVQRSESFQDIAKATYLFLCVKPDGILPVIQELFPFLSQNQVLVSIAAGVTIAKMETAAGKKSKIVRVMPNTPALIGKGVSAVAQNGNLSSEEFASVLRLLAAVGEVIEIPEKHFDAVTALSGSGPAYVYLFIYSLMQAGVHEGLPADVAKKLAVETVIGAAEMLKNSPEHPSALIDKVSSPGGTTIRALASLEKNGFRDSVIDAVKAAAQRSRELSEGNK